MVRFLQFGLRYLRHRIALHRRCDSHITVTKSGSTPVASAFPRARGVWAITCVKPM